MHLARFRHVSAVFASQPWTLAPVSRPELRLSASAPDGTPLLQACHAALAAFTRDLLRRGQREIYRQVCQEMDRAVLSAVLDSLKGNQVKASEVLGISRTTLRARLRGLNDKADSQRSNEE